MCWFIDFSYHFPRYKTMGWQLLTPSSAQFMVLRLVKSISVTFKSTPCWLSFGYFVIEFFFLLIPHTFRLSFPCEIYVLILNLFVGRNFSLGLLWPYVFHLSRVTLALSVSLLARTLLQVRRRSIYNISPYVGFRSRKLTGRRVFLLTLFVYPSCRSCFPPMHLTLPR